MISDTIFAPLTPIVTSSVILVRLSGQGIYKVFDYFRRKGGEQIDFKPNIVYHCYFTDGIVFFDDVILYHFKSPNSYTGEDVLEISFHGNPKIVAKAFETFQKKGFRFAEPGEFTKKAFLNGKIDLSQAEAVNEIISAKSEFGVVRSFEQLQGNLKNEMTIFRQNLLDVLAVIEVFTDFPDEEIDPIALKNCEILLTEVYNSLVNMIKSFDKMRIFKTGISVAIIGKPNVGKSSLLNAFLNDYRAIVSEIPGTTRDYIEGSIAVSGLPINFIDTAGIRNSEDIIEEKGINFSFSKAKSADVVLVLFDLSKPFTTEDEHILKISEGFNRIIVGNKSDIQKYPIDTDINISAKNRTHIDNLLELIYNRAVGVDVEQIHHNVLITERHYHTFSEVKVLLEKYISGFDINKLDLTAIDLHFCLDKISEVTGEKYTEALLDNIFSKFCIGK